MFAHLVDALACYLLDFAQTCALPIALTAYLCWRAWVARRRDRAQRLIRRARKQARR